MVASATCLDIEIQHDKPASDGDPYECSDSNAGADHASTTATNATNMIVSVIQCSADFVLTDSQGVISISLLFDCLDSLSMYIEYRGIP
jgi:hypothetical protein